MATVKFARPGMSGGFVSLPLLTTRLAAATGRPRRALRINVRPLASCAVSGTGTCSVFAGPGFGGSLRHASSALTDSLPSPAAVRSEEHTSELQSHLNLVCRLLLEKKKKKENKEPQRTNRINKTHYHT